jgi:hypothetical protein
LEVVTQRYYTLNTPGQTKITEEAVAMHPQLSFLLVMLNPAGGDCRYSSEWQDNPGASASSALTVTIN